MYNSMRKFCASSAAIKPASTPKEQAIADFRECGLGYTEITLLINWQCLQDGHLAVTRSAVRTCKLNIVRQEASMEQHLQGNRDASSDLT